MSTILHRLVAWADEDPTAVAQTYLDLGERKPITAKEFVDRVYWLALFLTSKGITQKDIGTILSYNRPEWVHMELAALLLGAKSAGIYPNSTPKDILYVLNHSQTRLLSVQNKEYFSKIVDESGKLALPSSVELVIVFDGDTSVSPKAISYQTALAQGKNLASKKGAKKLKTFLSELDPQSGAFIIYTSGTTGKPKGAVLSHDNLAFTIDRVAEHWKLPKGNGSLFSFLPLCHIAEKLQNVGAGISQRYTVHYCSKFENVSKELPEVQPTLLLCVPRLWEKMMEGVEKKLGEAQGTKKALAHWALQCGEKASAARYSGKPLPILTWFQWKLADQLVLSKIRKAAGLGRVEAAASGAAALSARVSRWFNAIGVEILEDFGQTETSGMICMTERGVDSAGTVGRPVDGIDFKLASDGEILTRGRHVFIGYYGDEKSTADAFTADGEGWLHTGDLGELDSRGLLKIRGRKKEILKTSGGKMIAPLPIEEALKASPMISQVCMVGDGKKYLSALITLSESKLQQLKDQNGALKGVLVNSAAVMDEVKICIDQLNLSLASFEQIKRFAILSKEFSIDAGEMTPTLKMKRNVIEDRYKDVISSLYE